MKISEEVMTVLSTADVDAHELRITAQLDRKLYVKTNKVLVALGGKWNRKANAHLFDGDAAELIESVLLTGEVTTAKDIGYFPTPDAVARVLIDLADLRHGDIVLEPSAGTGALVSACLQHTNVEVVAVERDIPLATRLRARFPVGTKLTVCPLDFLEWSCPKLKVDRVVMNPPFIRENGKCHLDHVRAAHSMLADDGILVSVLPKSVDFRMDRKHVDFRDWFEANGGYTQDLPDGSFKESGTMVKTVVLVMDASS